MIYLLRWGGVGDRLLLIINGETRDGWYGSVQLEGGDPKGRRDLLQGNRKNNGIQVFVLILSFSLDPCRHVSSCLCLCKKWATEPSYLLAALEV